MVSSCCFGNGRRKTNQTLGNYMHLRAYSTWYTALNQSLTNFHGLNLNLLNNFLLELGYLLVDLSLAKQ